MPLMPIDGPSKGPEHKVHNCEYKHDKEALEGWEVLFLNQSRCPDCFGKIGRHNLQDEGDLYTEGCFLPRGMGDSTGEHTCHTVRCSKCKETFKKCTDCK